MPGSNLKPRPRAAFQVPGLPPVAAEPGPPPLSRWLRVPRPPAHSARTAGGPGRRAAEYRSWAWMAENASESACVSHGPAGRRAQASESLGAALGSTPGPRPGSGRLECLAAPARRRPLQSPGFPRSPRVRQAVSASAAKGPGTGSAAGLQIRLPCHRYGDRLAIFVTGRRRTGPATGLGPARLPGRSRRDSDGRRRAAAAACPALRVPP